MPDASSNSLPDNSAQSSTTPPASAAKPRELYIGLMSGTSIDGIDGVLIEISPDGRLNTLAAESLPWPKTMKDLLNDLSTENSANDRIKSAGLAANAVATAGAAVCVLLMEKAKVNHTQIRAIGSHGQTIRHHPDLGFSMQLDNGPLLANLTDIDTIVNFRAADLANGGEGAPLTQAFHQSVLSSSQKTRFVLNLGGIANVTALAPLGKLLTAFDTGPANTLLDYVCRNYLNCPFDKDGAHAAAGKVDQAALDQLMRHQYLARPYPKSTGREEFNAQTIEFMLQGLEPVLCSNANKDGQAGTPTESNSETAEAQTSPENMARINDILCTLTEFTVRSSLDCIAKIAQDFAEDMSPERELIVCGGGALNQYLLSRMQAYADELDLHLQVLPCTDLGLDPKYLEAQAFAFFAFCCAHAISLNLCSSTKAKRPSILGSICPAPLGFYARAMARLDHMA